MSKNINSLSKLGLKTMAAMMLSACGGGGGGESTEKPESYRPVERRELTDNSVYTPVVNVPERIPATDPVGQIPEYNSVSTPIYSDISSAEIPFREPLAHRIVNINPRNNHFIESDNLTDDNTHEYVFELRRDSQGDNLIDYTFSHEISGRGANSFSLISSTVDGHRYRLRVRYAPQDNSTCVHQITLFVYATDSQRTHQLTQALQLKGYRPLNRSLSVPEGVRRDAIRAYFEHALLANSLSGTQYNTDHGLVFSSGNISQFAQDAWIDSRRGMRGQQFVFPFNVPLVQTYNPINALFANQLAIKTYAENGDELFFVVQYKPEAQEIYDEVGTDDFEDSRLNTIIKHHALFSDGLAPMRSLNITGDLSVDRPSSSDRISINPHDGTWSPAENNRHIKDKLFASQSSYIVSELSNISNGHNKIVSVNVLLNAADYSALSHCIASNMSGANFPYTLDVKRLLQDRAIPQVFKEAATAYNQLFLTYNMAADQQNIATPMPNSPLRSPMSNMHNTTSNVNQNLIAHNAVRTADNNNLPQNTTTSNENNENLDLYNMLIRIESNNSTMGNVNEHRDLHNRIPVTENINNPTIELLRDTINFASNISLDPHPPEYKYPFRCAYGIADVSSDINRFNQILATACDLVAQDNNLELQQDKINNIRDSFNNEQLRRQLLLTGQAIDSPLSKLKMLWQQAKKVNEYETDYNMSTDLAIAYSNMPEELFESLKIFEPEGNDTLSPMLKRAFINHVIREAGNDICVQINYAKNLLEVFDQAKLVEMYPLQTDQNPMPENVLISLVENSQVFKDFFANYVNATDAGRKSRLLQNLLQEKRELRINDLKGLIAANRLEREASIGGGEIISDNNVLTIWQNIQVNTDVDQNQVKYNPFINSLLGSFDFDFMAQLENEYQILSTNEANNRIKNFFNPMISTAIDFVENTEANYDIISPDNSYGLLLKGANNSFDPMREYIYFRLRHLYEKIAKDKGAEYAHNIIGEYIFANNGRCLDGKKDGLIMLENQYIYGITDFGYQNLLSATGSVIELIFFKDRADWIKNFNNNDFSQLLPSYYSSDREAPTYIKKEFIEKAYLAINLAKPSEYTHYRMNYHLGIRAIIGKLNEFYGDGYRDRLVNLLKNDMAQKEGSAIKDRNLDFILYTLGGGTIKGEYFRVQSYLANYSQYMAEEHYMNISSTDDKDVIDNGLPDQFEFDGETIEKPKNLTYFTFPNQPKYELLKNNGWRTMINKQFAITVLREFGYLP